MKAKWPEEKMRLWVTLYTDAGWKEGRTRVGFIARNSRAPLWKNGSGEANVDSPEAGEALAVLFGLRHVLATWTPVEGVFLRIDCLNLVRKLQFDRRDPHFQRWDSLSGDVGRILRNVRDLTGGATVPAAGQADRVALHVKHVRAHGREANEVRRWMNEQADKLGNLRRKTS